MRILRTLLIAVIAVATFGLSIGMAWATPSSDALFAETNLGGGLWKYDFMLYNTSDPLGDAGHDLYDFFPTFSPAVTLTNILSPSNWDFISDSSSFIDWYSTLPGEPPIGSDIGPGVSLSGFSLTSDTRLFSLPYEATLSNPNDPSNPVVYSGTTYFAPIGPVPEPSTVFLLGSGLIGLAGFARKKSER